MRILIRALSVLGFSVLFVLLMGGLFARAEETPYSGLIVQSVSPYFPFEVLRASGVKMAPQPTRPWYATKLNRRYRIFTAAGLSAKVKNWTIMRQDMFLVLLGTAGPEAAVRKYPEFTSIQIAKADEELQKVMQEP